VLHVRSARLDVSRSDEMVLEYVCHHRYRVRKECVK
jgi:hypothetical protein